MPSKAAVKLLERMRNSKTGWKRTDLERLYSGFGFIIKPGGSHDKVSHPEFPQLITSLPRHTRVAEYLVTQAIRLIDQLEVLEQEREKPDEQDNS